MLTKSCIVIICLFALAASGNGSASAALQAENDTLLTSRNAGSIRIGIPPSSLVGFDVSEEKEIREGISGFELRREGEVVALVATGGGAEAPINLIIAIGTMFRTWEDIGPGSTVTAAERAYGTAILSYSPTEAGRERLTVSSGPPGLQFFTAESSATRRGGLYPEDRLVTTTYLPGAVIESVWIDCRAGRPCPPPAPPRQVATTPPPAAPTPPPAATEPEPSVVEAAPVETPEALATTGPSRLAALLGLTTVGLGLFGLGTRNVLRMAHRDGQLRRRS